MMITVDSVQELFRIFLKNDECRNTEWNYLQKSEMKKKHFEKYFWNDLKSIFLRRNIFASSFRKYALVHLPWNSNDLYRQVALWKSRGLTGDGPGTYLFQIGPDIQWGTHLPAPAGYCSIVQAATCNLTEFLL